MKKQLRNDIITYFNIKNYKGESNSEYNSRLVYSAMCEWIRYCILDKTNINEFEIEIKSKHYIKRRCEEILNSLLSFFPECKSYFYKEQEKNNNNNPINVLRTKMIENGELVDSLDGVSLPKGLITSISNKYFRVLGIDNTKCIYSGITKLAMYDMAQSIEGIGEEINEFVDQDFFTKLKDNLNWENISDGLSLEILNPLLKAAPYKCWSRIMSLNENEIYLARMQIKDYYYEYYWLMKKKKIKISKINEHYQTFKEYRRFILWQRKEKENAIVAEYKILGHYVRVKLNAGLPYREQKVFDTYGWPTKNILNRMEYIIPKIIWNEVKDMLINLCFELKEVQL